MYTRLATDDKAGDGHAVVQRWGTDVSSSWGEEWRAHASEHMALGGRAAWTARSCTVPLRFITVIRKILR